MRASFLAVVLLVAGCVGAPTDTSPDANTTAPATPTVEANEPAPAMGERGAATMERFVLVENHTIGLLATGAPEMTLAKVPETLAPSAFYQSPATAPDVQPWTTFPFGRAFETTAEFDIIVNFVADAPAVGTTPGPADFPPVGGWFGTTERYAFFLFAPDAPTTLDAGKTYSVKLHVPLPKGGFFVRAGEQIAFSPFLAYQAADGSAVKYVVGGPDPAGFVMPHSHFNLSAPMASSVLEKSGDLLPNPGVSADQHPQPVDLPFKVPADALYVVLEVTGAPKAGTHIDVDVTARTNAGDTIMGGSSARDHEMVVLGPGNLAAAGRDLVARVACSSCAGGGTFSLKITAYGPATVAG